MSRSVALSRAGVTAPIHTWVLALLVALCLAFGLSPFFLGEIDVDGGAKDPPADVASQHVESSD